jgi:hypothetical protein
MQTRFLDNGQQGTKSTQKAFLIMNTMTTSKANSKEQRGLSLGKHAAAIGQVRRHRLTDSPTSNPCAITLSLLLSKRCLLQ